MNPAHQATAWIVGVLIAVIVLLIGVSNKRDIEMPAGPIPTCENGGRTAPSDCGRTVSRDV